MALYLPVLMKSLCWNNINSGAEAGPPTVSPWHRLGTIPMPGQPQLLPPILVALPVLRPSWDAEGICGVPCQGTPWCHISLAWRWALLSPFPKFAPKANVVAQVAHSQLLPRSFPAALGSGHPCPHPCPKLPVFAGGGGWTHSPVQLQLLRAGDKSRARRLCSGSGQRGPGRGNPPERNQQLNTFTSPLICRFCHEILLQRA